MNASYRNIGIAAIVALIIRFCIGFIPEHIKSTNEQEEIAALTQGKRVSRASSARYGTISC